MMHEIVLNGYTAHNSNNRCLHFGTAESYGIEQIHITVGPGWEDMLIKAVFHPPSGEAVTALIGEDGIIAVPPEATSVPAGEYNPGVIVFSGVSEGVQRISANLAYTVIGHASVDGKDPEPTPSQWEQLAVQYQSKVDKQQGAENAGKVLGIGEDGMVKPVEQTGGGGIGNDGATFTPSVSEDGVISWTNDGDLPNPEPVNIKGPKGDNYNLTETDKQEIAGMVDVPGGGTVAGVEPADDDIPKAFFGGALQQTKDEAIVPFRYISKTQDFSGFAEIKAQGDSSMNYPKKNQTVKLFKDAACTEKLKVDLKGWGKQNKFCFKANWIDLTHARNIVSARLWGDVVRSRTNFEELPELLRSSPNTGAIDGFPVKVYAAGVYQGRYTINIPKDAWMASMDDDLDTHCILCGENYVSGCFRASANINGSDWTDEVHDAVPAAIKTRWNEVISFVMNSTDDDFRANLGNYFDVSSLIDYHLYGLASCGLDAYGKNQLYMAYDGQKWIACMYDMDSTWGLYYTGGKIVPTDYNRTDYEDFVNGRQGNLLYIRLEQLFFEELQARWTELKNGALSIENVINRFERFTDIAPIELVEEDYASTTGGGKFTSIPSQSTNNIQQIRAFALARQNWTDEYIADLKPVVPIPCEGITLSETSLTFTEAGNHTLTAMVTPEDTTDAVMWESSDNTVVSVSSGLVTAVGNGNATITATCGGHSAICAVSVSIPNDSETTITSYTLTKGTALNSADGTDTAYDAGFVSDYIAVPNCTIMAVECTFAWMNICAYNANKQYIKTLSQKGNDTKAALFFTNELEDVSFIRVSCEQQGASNATATVTCKTLSNNARTYSLTNGLTLSSAGEIKSGNGRNYANEEYVSVSPGSTYEIFTPNGWLDVKGYNSDKAFVSALNNPSAATVLVKITIPQDVYFVRWGCTGDIVNTTTSIVQVLK